MTTQPKTEQLADELENTPFLSTRYEAAAKMRRLEAANAELLEALNFAYTQTAKHDERLPFDWALYCEALHMAIKKHGGAA